MKVFNAEKELKKLNRRFSKRNLGIGIFAILIALTIGSSYAIFSIPKQDHVILKGTVGDFTVKDIQLAVLVEGEKQDNFPAKGSGYMFDSVICDNGTTGTWDSNSWNIKIYFKGPDKCIISFVEQTQVEAILALNPSNLSLGRGKSGDVIYTYNGDGEITCSAPETLSCTINTSTKTISVKHVSGGDGNYVVNILASETSSYFATSSILNVSVTCLDPKTFVYIWDRKRKKKRKIRIKDVKVGDIVYSYNETKKSVVTSVVKKVHINKSRDIYDLYVDGEVIRITGSHPLFVNGMGYCEVNRLEVGYELIGLDGQSHVVEKVEPVYVEEECEMYCLELENNKSFSIGKNSLVSLAMYVGILSTISLSNEMAVSAVVGYGY